MGLILTKTRPPHRQPRRPADPPGLAVRRIAVDALASVLQQHAALDDTLDRLLAEAGDSVADRDRALARAIATAACRHLGNIRAAIAARLAKGLPRNAGQLEAILVAGAAQILYLDVPDHAAVDLAVQLAKTDARAFPYAKLANAVLRRIADDRAATLAGVDPLAVDTPAWLRERWTRTYGEATARAMAEAHAREPAVDITVKGDAAAWAERLNGLLLPTGSIRLRERGAIPELPGYADGAWWVQDAAAALPARLIAPRAGERILDLCAAPGGKTAQLAAAGAAVMAVDRSAERLKRLKANMARLQLTVETHAADALDLDLAPFDAVLLDAPCSATGTIRRHPDVAWTKREADVAGLAALQARLLDKAATLVGPGGRLVYCTCSLEPEEGERQIAAFLARHPAFRRSPIAAEELGGLAAAVTPHGELRTLPCHLPHDEPRLAGLDGFFAARLLRD